MLIRTFGNACTKALFLLAAFVESEPDARAQCGPQWLPGEGLPGVDGTVRAATLWDPDGGGPQPARYVIAGRFKIAGSRFALGIAMWDGAAWSPFGSAAPDPQFSWINALAVLPSGELVAGGIFTSIGGSPANRVARWNGSAWLPLGLGLSGTVSSLLVMPDGDLVAGGTFNFAGGAPANNIARWNGTTWSALGAGILSGLPQPANVQALAVRPDGDLIAGGHFLIAGGAEANFIAGWNGTSWYPLGEGMWSGNPADVYALAVLQNGDVVAGGGFFNAGGVDVTGLARWDGTNWHALGTGVVLVEAPALGKVFSLTVLPNGNLIVGGMFSVAGGVSAKSIALWNGADWSAIGSGVRDDVKALAASNNGDFIAAGSLTRAGDSYADNVARWNGNAWSALSPVLPGGFAGNEIKAFTIFDSGNGPELVAGGWFANAPNGTLGGTVARWDGTAWSPLGTGMNGQVHALAAFDDGNGADLYAGGIFSTADGQPASNIAKWNGAFWSAVGDHINGRVSAMVAFDDGNGPALYVGGEVAFGDPYWLHYGVIRWDGTNWSGLSDGGLNAPAEALVVRQNGNQPMLFAGGAFSEAGGQTAWRVAGWNGTQWSALSPGANTEAWTLAVLSNGDLIAGASVIPVGARSIAGWNGSTWYPLGSGLGSASASVAMSVLPNGDLIAAGNFQTAGGNPANSIARWNGSTWSPLGSGITGGNEFVSALHTLPSGELAAAGSFDTAGDNSYGRWARWADSPTPWVARQPQDQTVSIAGTASFTSAPANGYSDVTYQWQRNGSDVADGPGGASPGGGTVSGASGTLASPTYVSLVTLTIDGAQSSDDGAYTVVFTNPCGSATSNAATLLVCGCGLADVDCNGAVDLADLAALLSNFGRQDSPPRSAGNLDGDSDVDLADLTQMLSAFGAPCN